MNKITVSNSGWIWTKESIHNHVEAMSIMGKTDELIALAKDRGYTDLTGQNIDDALFEMLRKNQATPEEVFGLPETVTIEAAEGDDWDEEAIAIYLTNEYGFCIGGEFKLDTDVA